MIAETRSYIFRWRSRFCRCRVCLSSLLPFHWSFYFIQYTNCTVLNAPSQRSNAKIYLSSGSASLQTFQETDTKICETSVSIILRPKVMPVFVTSCKSILMCQHDRRIENLTHQIPNCPVTGRYFQPWRMSKIASLNNTVQVNC